MLKQIFESMLSKLGELILVYALNSINELGQSLKTLQKDLKLLSVKAFDVEEEIKNAEALGQKKRKREVEEWLVDVDSLKREVAELLDEVEGAGFIGRMMSVGKATRLSEQVKSLVDQSRHFGELVLDRVGERTRRDQTLMTVKNVQLTWTELRNEVASRICKHVVVGVFSSLKTLRIENCNQITNLRLPVRSLPNLEEVIVLECKEMEDIFEEDKGRDAVALPKLREVKLYDMPRLKSLCKETLICNSIRRISINKCPSLTKC